MWILRELYRKEIRKEVIMEIERRFLVRNLMKVEELVREYGYSSKRITQDYVYSDELTAIRKRKIEKNGVQKFIYTVKTGRKGISVNEFETEITEDTYNSLAIDNKRITIIKDRYCIPYIDDLVIELDIFQGKYKGLVFAEIEYKSEEQADSTKVPDWFDKEIGSQVSNCKMSMGEIDIEKLLNE